MADNGKFKGERLRAVIYDEAQAVEWHVDYTTADFEAPCDPQDDVQDHHLWVYPDIAPLGVCARCGALSQAWEE